MARRRKSTYTIGEIDLNRVIGDILSDYSDEVATQVSKRVPKVADDTIANIERKAPERTGEYAKSWDVRYTRGANRLDKSAIIFSHMPGLPHLLEFGHATKNGGRTRKIEHIKPAEEEAVRDFEKAVREAIDDASERV